MDYLGLFCLGAFVGAIATAGLRFVSGVGEWQKVLALVLPAVLSGAALLFVDKFKYSPAFGCYPLGLLVALLWAYSDRAVTNIGSSSGKFVLVGLAHLTAAVIITVVAGVVVTLPAYWQLVDEFHRPPGDTLAEYRREVARAASTENVATGDRHAPTSSVAAARR